MAFMNFNGFFYARNDLRLFKIEKNNISKSFLFYKHIISSSIDTLNPKNEFFFYESLKNDLFNENDEILISNLNKNIILFKNFTQNTDNFKEAKKRHLNLVFFLLIMSFFFATLAITHAFNTLDLIFLTLCFLLLVMSFINFGLLIKQINIFKSLSKEQINIFLQEKMQKYNS